MFEDFIATYFGSIIDFGATVLIFGLIIGIIKTLRDIQPNKRV